MMADRSRHLADDTLLALLDHALDPPSEAEAHVHLAACADCRHRQKRWARLFTRMESVRPDPVGPDLAEPVLAQIRARRTSSRFMRGLLFSELGLALAAVAALGLSGWPPPGSLALLPRLPDVAPAVARWTAGLAALWRPLIAWPQPLALRSSMLEFRLPSLELPLLGWAALLGGALIVGLIGNSLLLRSEPRSGPAAGGANVRR
jgi:hypothetical protein